jgi:hypothetical protein
MPQGGQDSHLYLLGDSIYSIDLDLHNLLSLNGDPIVKLFFELSYKVLRSEISALPSTTRAEFGRFSSIRDLLSLQRRNVLHPALHKALVCSFQLGSVLRYVFALWLDAVIWASR